MMPHEVNALIAKVVFVIASAFALCMAKVRAEEISYHAPTQIEVVQTTQN